MPINLNMNIHGFEGLDSKERRMGVERRVGCHSDIKPLSPPKDFQSDILTASHYMIVSSAML